MGTSPTSWTFFTNFRLIGRCILFHRRCQRVHHRESCKYSMSSFSAMKLQLIFRPFFLIQFQSTLSTQQPNHLKIFEWFDYLTKKKLKLLKIYSWPPSRKFTSMLSIPFVFVFVFFLIWVRYAIWQYLQTKNQMKFENTFITVFDAI